MKDCLVLLSPFVLWLSVVNATKCPQRDNKNNNKGNPKLILIGIGLLLVSLVVFLGSLAVFLLVNTANIVELIATALLPDVTSCSSLFDHPSRFWMIRI